MKYILIIILFLSQRGYSQVDAIIDRKIESEMQEYLIDSTSYIDTTSLLGTGDKSNKWRVNPRFVSRIIREMILTDAEIKKLKPVAGQQVFNLTLGRWQTYTTGAWR